MLPGGWLRPHLQGALAAACRLDADAILRAVGAAAIAAIGFGVLVLGGLALLGLRALSLWRAIKAARSRVAESLEALAREGDRISASMGHLPRRQAELQSAMAALGARTALARRLADHASEAAAVLRAPLRYLGG